MQSLTRLLLTVQMSYSWELENQLKCCYCSRKHVVFNVEDRILVENLYKFKGYRAKNSKFPDKGQTVNGLNYLLKKLRNTGTTAGQPGNGRRQSARTVENVDTVNEPWTTWFWAIKVHWNASNHASNCKGDRHSSLTSVHHYLSGFSIKMSEEMVCTGTHCSNCIH